MHPTLLIVVDGLRPDALSRADVPNIQGLLSRGAYSLEARTVTPSATLPVHFSIFTGLKPVDHGVLTNVAPPSLVPGLFSSARAVGLKTAAFYNWEQLRSLSNPGDLCASFFLDNAGEPDGDVELARLAAGYFANRAPDLAFVYFGGLDLAGHAYSFNSTEYLETLGRADRALGIVLAAWTAAAPVGRVLLLSDHGGCGHDHVEDRPENMTVPFIAAGPGIRAAWEIKAPVSIPMVRPLISEWLGLPERTFGPLSPLAEIYL
ncbi:MAG: alkaline phosphatase family protein [Pseudomonadota bacterium]